MKIIETVKNEIVVAATRPDLQPVFEQFNPNLTNPEIQKAISAAEEAGVDYNPPIAPGTFWDIFMSPEYAALLSSKRGAKGTEKKTDLSLINLQQNISRIKKHAKAKIDFDAGKIDRLPKQKTPNIPDISGIYKFNSMFNRFMVNEYEAAVPVESRNVRYSESSDGIIDKMLLNFKANTHRLKNKVIVSKLNNDWRINLPVGNVDLTDFLSNGIGTTISTEARRTAVLAFIKSLSEIGIDINSSGKVDTVISFEKFKGLAKGVVLPPSFKSFLNKYVVGIRFTADKLGVEKTTAVEKFIKSSAASDTVVHKTNPQEPSDLVINERASLKKVTAADKYDSDFEDSDGSVVNEREQSEKSDVTHNESTGDSSTVDVNQIQSPNSIDLNKITTDYEHQHLLRIMIEREIICSVVVTLPATEAEYYFQSPADEIKPSYILDFFNCLYSNSLLPVIPYYTPMSKIEQVNSGYAPHVRSNEDGLCVNDEAVVFYIPTVNNIKLYEESKELMSDDGTGEFTYNDKKLPSNQLIYTDWVNNKFTYTDNEGSLVVLDMERFYPVSAGNILALIQDNLASLFDKMNNSLTTADLAIWSYTGESAYNFIMNYYNSINWAPAGSTDAEEQRVIDITMNRLRKSIDNNYLNNLIETLATCYSEALVRVNQADSETDVMLNLKIFDLLSQPFASGFRAYFEYAAKEFKEHTQEILTKYAEQQSAQVSSILTSIGMTMVLAKYISDDARMKLRAQHSEDRAPYRVDTVKGVPGYIPKFHNVSKDMVLKKYQERVMGSLDSSPPFAILAVDAGGGKTAMVILNIMQELQRVPCKVKRPLVCCPSHLVKDYVAEINAFYKGKMNAVVLTNFVLKGYGKSQMLELVAKAPVNTIFITDYDVFKLGQTLAPYSTSTMESFRWTDFFRSAGFDGVWCDESHLFKNKGSSRASALSFAISEIPVKRLCSGTLTPNKLSDLVNQFAMLDPTVFGNPTSFATKLSSFETTDQRGAYIRARLKENCMYISVNRREWAWELPIRNVSYFTAHLTPNQLKAYSALLDVMLKELDEEINGKKKLVEDDEGNESLEKPVQNDESEDDEDSTAIQKLLEGKRFKTMLCDLEMFAAAPISHEKSKEFLTEPDDLVSPKGKIINKIIRRHLNANIPGKILIFTNWNISVDAIMDALDPDIKAMTLRYRAETKFSSIRKFQTDDKLKVMIGIGKSMNTGLNLQFCSRLILSETVWSPGDFEQSIARVYRPVKLTRDKDGTFIQDKRSEVYIDNIVVDKTLDCLKTAALIFKQIQVSKTFNGDNDNYKAIPDVNPIKLSLKNIRQLLLADTLTPYYEAQATMFDCEQKDYDDYTDSHPEVKDRIPVNVEGNLEGSKLLSKIPYTPGMTILDQDALGLVPFLEWRRLWMENHDGKFNESEIPETIIHTELGEGIFRSYGNLKKVAKNLEGDDVEELDEEGEIATERKVKVVFNVKTSNFDLSDIEVDPEFADRIFEEEGNCIISFNPTTVFVVTKTESTAGDIRRSTLEGLNLPIVESDIQFIVKNSKDIGTKARLQKAIEAAKNKAEKIKAREERDIIEQKRKATEIIKAVDEGKKVAPTTPVEQTKTKRVVEENQRRGRPTNIKQKDPSIKPERKDVRDVVPQDRNNKLPKSEVRVYLANINNMLGLMLNLNDTAAPPKVMKDIGFKPVDPYIQTRITTMKNFEAVINKLAPVFDDGTRITTKTPVIRSVKALTKQGKFYVSKTGIKYPADVIEQGHYVMSKDELPRFDITDDSFEAMDSLYEEFRQNQSGTLVIENSPKSKMIQFERLSHKHLPAGTIRPYLVVLQSKLHLCVDINTTSSKDITALKAELSDIPRIKFVVNNNDYRAIYSTRSQMIQGVRDIKAHFDIVNLDELQEAATRIKSKGKKAE